jgi:hypothetical protein
MNERIRELYQQAHEPQPPTRGTGTLTKDILWEQPDKFNPEKFAELIVRECASHLNWVGDDAAGIELLEHFGVEE